MSSPSVCFAQFTRHRHWYNLTPNRLSCCSLDWEFYRRRDVPGWQFGSSASLRGKNLVHLLLTLFALTIFIDLGCFRYADFGSFRNNAIKTSPAAVQAGTRNACVMMQNMETCSYVAFRQTVLLRVIKTVC